MKIAILDTYYPDFLASRPNAGAGSYATELRKTLECCFGTFDAYSHHLTALGWECQDFIVNYEYLQRRWAAESGIGEAPLKTIALHQIHEFNPDVIFLQDLSFFDAATLQHLQSKYLLAGQCSCAMPKRENLMKFDVLFTSLPHFVDAFRLLGIERAEYLPLAFDPRLLGKPQQRQFEISFVGGVGRHWEAGNHLLEMVARAFEDRFIWFGYGRENLPAGSALRACYAGPAWGRDMYDVYARSKIVVNRHGEVSAGYSNNLRMFEATGMGALLLTEESMNLGSLFRENEFETYRDPEHAVQKIQYYLNHPEVAGPISSNGQRRTLADHVYHHRMKTVSELLIDALEDVAA